MWSDGGSVKLAPDEPRSEEPVPAAVAPPSDLHVIVERVSELERWLRAARCSLGAAGADGKIVQDSLEKHLLNCQEMLLEIEQKVNVLSRLGSDPLQLQDYGSTRSQQEAAEVLLHKLDLLKSSLVSFQQLLQDKQEERDPSPEETEVRAVRPLEKTVRRRGSVQDILSAPRNKLLRQSSLQQQKELEQELSEQRGLTRALSRQCSRARLRSQESEELSQPSTRSCPVDVDPDSSLLKWDRLHAELLSLEQTLLPPPSEVADASIRRTDGAAGRMIVEETRQELRTLVGLLRELGHNADQDSSEDVSHQTLDEGLFHVLSGTSLSLSALNQLLHSPAAIHEEEEGQQMLLELQSLSSELELLRSELVSQGSKVTSFLRSDKGQRCMETVARVVTVMQTGLSERERHIRKRQEETASKQRKLKELHAAFTSNRSTVHQITHGLRGNQLDLTERLQTVAQVQEALQHQAEEVNSLMQDGDQHRPQSFIQQASQLKVELESALVAVSSRFVELKGSVELQQTFDQLLFSLKELLSLGSEHVDPRTPNTELHSKNQLLNQLTSHTKFFQFLQQHFKTLQFLSQRFPESFQQTVEKFQDEVVRLQQRGLEKGSRMEEILQMWTQWEQDCEWMDSLLRNTETSFPIMLWECASEEQNNLSVYQGLADVLEENSARVGRLLKLGAELQTAGCRGAGAVSRKLDARWKTLTKRVDREQHALSKHSKLRSRFFCDLTALTDWMGGAREMIDRQQVVLSANEKEVDSCSSKAHFLQFKKLSKELETKAGLKAAVTATGSELLQMKDSDRDLNKEKDPDPGSVSFRLKQIELLWSGLTADVPVVLKTLHKRWLQSLTQQGALQELQSFLKAIESQLNEESSSINQTSKSDLNQLLNNCKDCQIDMEAHQATLDFINQPLQTSNITEDHRGRCDRNVFSEEQGRLNHQWLSLKHELISQINSLELQLKMKTERESCLQQISSWIQEQSVWMDSAQKPSSHTEIQKSLSCSRELEQKIRLQSEALQDLKETENSVCEFIFRIDMSSQDCVALKQKNDLFRPKLLVVQQLWDSVDKRLNEMRIKTVKTSQSLAYNCGPQFCLQAQTELNQGLQLLQEETEASESDWAELSETVSSLKNMIHPSAAVIITEQTNAQRQSRCRLSDVLSQKLQKSFSCREVWEVYHRLAASFSQRLETLQSDASSALNTTQTDDTEEQFTEKIQHIQSLLSSADSLQSDLQEVLDASKHLSAHLDPPASTLVQSETRMFSRGILQLSQSLKLKLGTMQEELQRLLELMDLLTSLETDLELWHRQSSSEQTPGRQSEQLDVSGRSADLDVLNELSHSVPLSPAAANRLLQLNQCWTRASSREQEAASAMQTEALRRQDFEEKCDTWMGFLQKMEDSLAVDVAGSYSGLRQQLCTHKRFQSELSLGHQILHSVITDALRLLQRGEVDDRDDFLLKLAALRQHWQGAVQRAEHRRCLVEGLVRHWHLYVHSLRKLQRFLSSAQGLLPPAGLSHCSLRELRCSLHHLQHTELMFQRYQSSFLHTLEVGRQLFSMGDEETQAQLQSELGTLQEEWDNLHELLGRRMDLTEAIIKNWELCETGLANSTLRLKDVKTRLNQSMPEFDDDLPSAERCIKENEDLIEDWAESLTELSSMKTDLSQYIIADDVMLLQEQVDHLHCQWDELCLKVSLRKQEIADRLNAWIIFNEKNKELCEWLTQMENRVAHSSDLNIEEMVEKLKKDCMEEINLFSENKTHLKKLGEQLLTASNKTKETEINDKLKDINDRWQHLFDHIEARVRKLKETLVTVQQLDKNMSNLRTWLSRIEAELSKPVVYSSCHSDEIQRKLAEQQDLQRDIEQHTESVASVLTLCDVLLHDADACGSDSENDSVQQTTLSLDRRWRNICAMSMERRMRIEETWRLWCKFLDDYSRFEDWLKSSELTAANPESENVLYTSAKEELKKFEAFQRRVHERLTQLELVNKQYRRLARENRTDAASKLKVMVHEGNQRWDALQRRVAAVLRRLKHFTSQREDFEGTREAILVWLTEMDLQLTNVEHFSESDIEDKMRQLNVFQQEIMLNTNKIDALIVFGENMIQKSAPLDAVVIEDELEELHSYCQEVFGRVARFHHRLANRRPVLEDLSDSDLDDSTDLSRATSWTETKRRRRRRKRVSDEEAGRQVMCQLLAPPLERSGRETPVSVDSIPLEWDHTVDVGGSSSQEEEEDDAPFFSALSVKSVSEPHTWLQNESPKRQMLRDLNPSPSQSCSTPYHQQGYVKLLSECSGSIDSVKKVKLILNDDEERNNSGLTSSTADKQTNTGVIERWELLRVQSHSGETDITKDLQQWQKLNSNLCDLTSWLGRLLPELDRLQCITLSTTVRDMEVNIRKLKEMQKSFTSYKCLMISVNLSSRQFLHGDSAEVRELQDALNSANHSWTQACSGLESWERRLHQALMQCQEFHETLHSLLLWLAQSENKLYGVNIRDQSVSRSTLLQHQDSLKALQEDLRGRQRQVSSLQDISSQLLLQASAEDSVEAKEKVHVISNKLRLLLRQVSNDMSSLNTRLETSSLSSSEVDSVGLGTITHSTPLNSHKEELRLQAATVGQPATQREQRRDAAPQRPFFYRVLRAAFPLHLLFLLVLVLACLVPLSEEDYSCTLSNNFARSFYPMLRYTNGPPPT